MNSKVLILGLIAASALAGCKDGDGNGLGPVEFTISHVPESVFSSFYVADFDALESAANALRTLNPLYTIQQFSWSNGSGTPIHDSYSLANGRVEYAHAAGLTGAGQTISIVDNGFLQTHIEFSGKTISTSLGVGVDNHGTGVASVAAGVSNVGEMIGVAPGANLQLGSFDTNASRAAANNQAAALGAIVQNNSWGFEVDVTQGNFNLAFSGTSGAAYYNSITNLAQNTIIVFAASNDDTRTTADIMAALPLIDASLQNSWVTVINAVPEFTGTTITDGTVISARCLEAAAWCMAADGASYAAQSSGGADYDHVFGSSFAAPQVSGAIALLAEAFPGLNSEELRARLLASADNGFYTHTGYVEFAPGLQHGYSDEFGHGFLNMKAALLPIGGSYLPRSTGGSVRADGPVVLSSGMSGDALMTRLANYDLMLVDGLGAGFEQGANTLSATGIADFDPTSAISQLLATELNSSAADPFVKLDSFAALGTTNELGFQARDTRIAMLMPDGQNSNFGLSVSRDFEMSNGLLTLGLSAMHEGAGFVGVQSLLPGAGLSGTHAEARWEWGFPVGGDQKLSVSGSFGAALPDGNMVDMALSRASYNSLNVSYSLANVWGRGDRIAFGIGLPQALQSGSAAVTLPMVRGDGATEFSTVDIGLAPEHRQVDLSVAYGMPLDRGSDLILRVVHSLNDSNVAGNSSTETTIGLRFSF